MGNAKFDRTIQQAAAELGCSSKTLYRYMSSGKLAYQRGDDGRRYLRKDELERIQNLPTARGSQAKQTLREAIQRLVCAEQQQERLGKCIELMIDLIKPSTTGEITKKQAIRRLLDNDNKPP